MTMGKKAKLKAIRRIATELPEIHVKRAGVPDVILGAELVKKGITKLPNGEYINTEAKYKKGTVVDAPVNHHRQMKKLYNKHGAAGVRSYVAAAERHVAKLEQQKEKVVEEKPAFDPAVGEGEE